MLLAIQASALEPLRRLKWKPGALTGNSFPQWTFPIKENRNQDISTKIDSVWPVSNPRQEKFTASKITSSWPILYIFTTTAKDLT